MARKVSDKHHPPGDFTKYKLPAEFLAATGGWLLMQAAVEAAAMKSGEAFGQSFYGVTGGGEHFAKYFDRGLSEEALDVQKGELVKLSTNMKYWAMVESTQVGNEGEPDSFSDALLVRMWIRVDARTLELVQRYRPAGDARIELHGPVEIFLNGEHVSPDLHNSLRVFIKQGIAKHPENDKWALWHEQ